MRFKGGGPMFGVHRLLAATRSASPAEIGCWLHRCTNSPLSLTGRWLALCSAALVLCLLSFAVRAADSPAAALRYDGVYVSEVAEDEETYCMYLRFYPDGSVVDASADCGDDALADIKQWLTLESAERKEAGIGRGKVKLSGSGVSFSTYSIEGKVSYQGELSGNTLTLKWRSYINNQDGEDTHTFKAW